MKDKKRARIEAEVAKLPLLFAQYADNGDHEAMADLFTEDCQYARACRG